jgi:Family of unknown function (DUF5685)
MFGLMRPINCSKGMKGEHSRDHRWYYCGVCKTIGSRFGNKMRLFLNHDIAFLAQLIGECGLETHTQNRDHLDVAFNRANCLVLPGKEETTGIPLSFQMAAAVNILLSELTITDKIADTGSEKGLPWQWLKKKISPAGGDARELLNRWKFPLPRLDALVKQQQEREKETIHHLYLNPDNALDYYSHSTALITGIVFQHAAMVSGNKTKKRVLFGLGYAFGQFIYLLDALEDFKKDHKKGHFNAIAAAYRYSRETDIPLTAKDKQDVIAKLHQLGTKIQAKITALPLGKERRSALSRQFKINVQRRLNALSINDQVTEICSTGITKQCHHKALISKPKGVLAFSLPHSIHRFTRNPYFRGGLFFLSLPFMLGLRYLSFSDGSNDPQGAPDSGRANSCDCCLGLACCDGCCNHSSNRRRISCCDCAECGCNCCASGDDFNCCDGCDSCDCCDC